MIYGDQSFRIPLQPVFPTSGSLDGFFQLIGSATASVDILYRVYDKNGKLVLEPEKTARLQDLFPTNRRTDVTFSLPYRDIAPGDYELEITLRLQPPCTENSRRVPFRIVPVGSP